MVSSKEKAEIESACEGGVQKYLTEKHDEYISGKMEDGLFGAIMGTIGMIAFSKYYSAYYNFNNIHMVIPAFSGIVAGGLIGIWGHAKLDEEHTEDFNQVCDSIQSN